jgi:hypothetical protein
VQIYHIYAGHLNIEEAEGLTSCVLVCEVLPLAPSLAVVSGSVLDVAPRQAERGGVCKRRIKEAQAIFAGLVCVVWVNEQRKAVMSSEKR